MKRVGLYFGSFNPIHIGHLIVADYFASLPEYDEVWLVISPQNPLKPLAQLADEAHRLEMVKFATEDNDRLRYCDIEFNLPRPSYTCDTLRVLREKYPSHNFTLIMGEDNKPTFHLWKDYLFILGNFPVRIFPRHGITHAENIEWSKYDVQLVPAPRIEISSTTIRARIAAHSSVQYILPLSVSDYISRHQLYIKQ